MALREVLREAYREALLEVPRIVHREASSETLTVAFQTILRAVFSMLLRLALLVAPPVAL